MREIEAVVGDSLEYGRDGHRRWYRFKPKQSNRLGLNFAELDFLSVYRDLAAPFLNSEDRVRIDTSLFNFSMLMADPSYQTGITRGANAKFVFTSKGRIDYTGHYETLERLAKALRGSLICLVRYRKAGAAEEREHSFAPGRIVSMNGALYVLGATVTKDASCIKHLISLAVHRIREVTVTDKQFLFKMPSEDLGLFGLPWHEPRNFRIRFAPGGAADYVRERIWSDQQRIVEQEDGGLVLELVSRSEPEVMSWVRSFGEEAELLDKDGDEQEPIANYAQPGGTIVPDFAGMDDMDEMEDLPEAEQGAQPGGDQASKAARSTAAQDGQHGGDGLSLLRVGQLGRALEGQTGEGVSVLLRVASGEYAGAQSIAYTAYRADFEPPEGYYWTENGKLYLHVSDALSGLDQLQLDYNGTVRSLNGGEETVVYSVQKAGSYHFTCFDRAGNTAEYAFEAADRDHNGLWDEYDRILEEENRDTDLD